MPLPELLWRLTDHETGKPVYRPVRNYEAVRETVKHLALDVRTLDVETSETDGARWRWAETLYWDEVECRYRTERRGSSTSVVAS